MFNSTNVIQWTGWLILAFLVLANADGFSKATNAIGSVYVNAVKALQGR